VIEEIIQYFDRTDIPKKYLNCMEKVEKSAKEFGVRYSLIIGFQSYFVGEKRSWFYDSALVRIKELSERRNCLWLDSDCMVDDNIFYNIFKKDKPYMFGGNCPSSAMFNNGYNDIFKNIVERFKWGSGCLCFQFLRANSLMFNIFPDKIIYHLNFSCGKK
jgi:hypothetical protein